MESIIEALANSAEMEGGKELPAGETPGPVSHLEREGHEVFHGRLRSPELKLLVVLVFSFVMFVLLNPKWSLAAYKENYFPGFGIC